MELKMLLSVLTVGLVGTFAGWLKMKTMNTRNLVPFVAGVVVGAAFLSTAIAAGLVPAWRPVSVTPVVLVKYNSLYGFQPIASDATLAPTWKKEDVTAVVQTTYNSLYGFVPLRSDTSSGLGPKWKSEQITPWTEVVYSSLGQFVTKNSE